MRRAIVLQHVPHEGPGLIQTVLEGHGCSVQLRRLHQGAAVPDADAGDILVVMGGPMGVGDLGDARYPFLADEIALLRPWIAADRPLIGICLGAQLIAHAAGARVYPHHRPGDPTARVYEVGWAPLDLLGAEPVLAGLEPHEPVLHWHGDTFDLPLGAVHLASTAACANQWFRLGRRVHGLQFHVEVSATMIANWVRADASFVTTANGADGGQGILNDTRRFMPRYRVAGRVMLDNIVRELLSA